MAVLEFDKSGERFFETGVDHVVLFPARQTADPVSHVITVSYPLGVAWNGVTSISESPDGADANDFYADNIKYLSLRGVENFGGSIKAYTYPDEWMLMDGSALYTGASSTLPGVFLHQQTRQTFGLAYRTKYGNDINPEIGYQYHLVYGATASPSSKDYATVNDSPSPIEFSWDFKTTPVTVDGFPGLKPVSHIVIDPKFMPDTGASTILTKLTNAIYGTTNSDSYLPLPGDLYTLLTST